jgi:hypothetical protein
VFSSILCPFSRCEKLGLNGSLIGFCKLDPFAELHDLQEVTTFSQLVSPFLDLGIT